jgi:hypothetical protein
VNMPIPNINKIAGIVILSGVLPLFLVACNNAQTRRGTPPVVSADASRYQPSVETGKLNSKDIKESSGLAASLCQKGVLWTLNDSGGGPFIFAIDETGKQLGTWRVPGVENLDWEAIDVFQKDGKCSVLIGEIGNSKDGSRKEHRIYSIAEPSVDNDSAASSLKEPLSSSAATALVFSYPDGQYDSEAMMVHPTSGNIYIVTKERKGPAAVYRLTPSAAPKIVAEKIGEIKLPAVPEGMITGGAISSDGTRVAITDYFAAYEFAMPAGGTDFEAVWKQQPTPVEVGIRKQGESLAYSADGQALLATSEGVGEPVMKAVRKQ